MASTVEVEKYATGFIFSQQAELESLDDPDNYLSDVQTARRMNTQNIETYQRAATERLYSNSKEAWARRREAQKALKDAQKRAKEIDTAEKEMRTQVAQRKSQLEKARTDEREKYATQVYEQEQKRKENEKKQEWLKTHKIGDIPKGIELGYLGQGSMSWYRRLKSLEAPYANRRTDLPSHERHKLEFLYKGGTEKEWGDIREREARNRAASKRQSASIKGAAAIVDSGGTLGGKFTGTGYDDNTGQLTGDSSANNWGGYGSKEAQQKALQQELAKSFQAHPTYFNKAQVTTGFSTGNQYFRDGKMITPDSKEGEKLQEVLTTQAITRDVNEKQRKLFSDISKADSALEAWNIRSKAMNEDPRVGTFNYLMKDGKVIETSGTIGIATKTEYTREEGGLNKDSPLVFKSEYDPSVVPIDPGFKGTVDTTPQTYSLVGYSPEGKPMQGPPEPTILTYEMPQFPTLESFARDQNMSMFEKATESSLKWLDEKQKETAPKNLGEGILDSFGLRPQSLVQIPLGVAKEGLAVGATVMNLSSQVVNPFLRDVGWDRIAPFGMPPEQREIEIPSTALGTAIEGGVAGDDVLAGQAQYMKERGVRSTVGEYLTLYPGKAAVKLLPITVKTLTAPGVSTTGKIVSFGYGKYSTTIGGLVDGKISVGVPKVQTPIKITAETPKQAQRGVALGGDTSKEMQQLLGDVENIKKIEGITPLAVERAEYIQRVMPAMMSQDEVLKSTKPMDKAFGAIEAGSEQESLFKSFMSQQGKLWNPFKEKLGAYEGSLSEQFFTDTKKFLRPSGDYDFNVKSFESAAKYAQRTADDFVGDGDRTMEAIIKDKTKIIKTKDVETGKIIEKEVKIQSAKNHVMGKKVGEFLHPDELDEMGVPQAFSGSAYMGRNVPGTTFKTDVGTTFGFKRQILKRGSSLFSAQITDKGVELAPAPFRFEKDVAMFYRTLETSKENLIAQGKTSEAAKIDLDEFRRLYEKDGKFIDEVLQTAEPEPISFGSTPSLQSSIADSPILRESSETVPSLLKVGRDEKDPGSVSLTKSVSATMEMPSIPAVKSVGSISATRSLGSVKSLGSVGSQATKSIVSKSAATKSITSETSAVTKSIGSTASLTTKSTASTSVATKSTAMQSPAISKLTGKMTSKSVARVSLTEVPTGLTKDTKGGMLGIKVETRKDEPKPSPSKKREEFVGNVLLDNIMGVGKKKDITYGSLKVSKEVSKKLKISSSMENRLTLTTKKKSSKKKSKKKKAAPSKKVNNFLKLK